MEEAKQVYACRSCHSEHLSPIISLGNQYVTNFVSTREEQERNVRAPLDLILCPEEKGGCGLVQLRHSAPPAAMWGDQYWYQSGLNRRIREDLGDIVEKSREIVPVSRGDIVIDIGCNDGTLLMNYAGRGVRSIGFEPSKNVAAKSREKGLEVINDFFNAGAYERNVGNEKAKIVSAISMFYDLEKPNEFLQDVKKVLAPNGLFVVQQNYLGTMLSNNAFDNICHEHLEYYSLRSFENLLGRNGLEVVDVAQNGINGGSIRTYIKRVEDSSPVQTPEARERVLALRDQEAHAGFQTMRPYQEFASRLSGIKNKINNFLEEEKRAGKTTFACGASTRGNVTLQYLGLDERLIAGAFDRNPDKFGKRTIGSFIPIYSPDERHNLPKIDNQLVLIWHIFKGLGADETEFLNEGGRFLLPMPAPKLISKEGEIFL